MTKSELTKLLEMEWDRGWNEAWNIAFEAGRADAATKLTADAMETAALNERLAMGAIRDLKDVHEEVMERADTILGGLTKAHKDAISSWHAFTTSNTIDPTAQWSEAKKAAKGRHEGPIQIPLKNLAVEISTLLTDAKAAIGWSVRMSDEEYAERKALVSRMDSAIEILGSK